MKLLAFLFLTSSAWRRISGRPVPSADPDAEAAALYLTYGGYGGYNPWGRGGVPALPAPADFAQPHQLYGGFGGHANGVQLLGGYGGGIRRQYHEPNYDLNDRHSQLRHSPLGAGAPGRYIPQQKTYPNEDQQALRRPNSFPGSFSSFPGSFSSFPGGFERSRSSGGIPENQGAICCNGLNAVVGGISSTQDGSVL